MEQNENLELVIKQDLQGREEDHHHGHHHSHRHSSRRRSRKWKKFYRKHKNWIRFVGVVLIMVLLAVGLMTLAEKISGVHHEEVAGQSSQNLDDLVMVAVSVYEKP